MDMNKQMHHQRKKRFLCCLLLTAILTACSDSSDHPKPVPQLPKVSGEVYLAPDSPKKAYVKTTSLILTQHPLLEPLTGKVTYNESVTSRISSPVAGRVIGTPIALGTQVQTGATLLELDSPDVAAAEVRLCKSASGFYSVPKKPLIVNKSFMPAKPFL